MTSFEQPDDPLVSTAWLAENLSRSDVKIVDATWLLQPNGRNAGKEFLERHIPGAFYFDIDEIKDDSSRLPHMLPRPEKFTSRMRKFGVSDNARVVVYAHGTLMAAARVWWTFRAMGHENTVVLDGGLEKWLAEGRPVEGGEPAFTRTHFGVRLRTDLVDDAAQVLGWSKESSRPILDARPADRFAGKAPEPRSGLRSGHIPGSKNLPASGLANAYCTLKSREELAALFEKAGVDPKARFTATCGSGVAASLLALAAARLGNWDVSVYDGSWSEWGARDDLPISTESA